MVVHQLPDGRLLMDREALARLTGRTDGAVRQVILRAQIQPVKRHREVRRGARNRTVPLYDSLIVAQAIEDTARRRRTVT